MKGLDFTTFLDPYTRRNCLTSRYSKLIKELKILGYRTISMRELESVLGAGCSMEFRTLIVNLKEDHYQGKITVPDHIIEDGIKGYERKRNFQILLYA